MIRATLYVVLLLSCFDGNAQLSAIMDYHEKYSEHSVGNVDKKSIDLDGDNDLDYIFSFSCGEATCIRIVLYKDGVFEEVISEQGQLSIELENSLDYTRSNIILKSRHNHCCGESPFLSYRSFDFDNNAVSVIDNYVVFDPWTYNEEDNHRLHLVPKRYLPDPYLVTIERQEYHVRFSSDLDSHQSSFTCIDRSNIIAKLKKESVVKVIGEHTGRDSEERTWLYVEIGKDALSENSCSSPLNYDFKDQKLRGWISDKYATAL